jgi:hypothetical protein
MISNLFFLIARVEGRNFCMVSDDMTIILNSISIIVQNLLNQYTITLNPTYRGERKLKYCS